MSLKHITISPENYDALKKLGEMGDSFNDVLSRILKNREKYN
jgi:predicted CopG family antitoxin